MKIVGIDTNTSIGICATLVTIVTEILVGQTTTAEVMYCIVMYFFVSKHDLAHTISFRTNTILITCKSFILLS